MRSVVVSMCVSSRAIIPALTECFGTPLRSACDIVAAMPSVQARRMSAHSAPRRGAQVGRLDAGCGGGPRVYALRADPTHALYSAAKDDSYQPARHNRNAALMSRLRGSHHCAAPSFAGSGIDGHWQLLIVWLRFRSPHRGLAARMMRTSEPHAKSALFRAQSFQ
jgi:hypothetical protein